MAMLIVKNDFAQKRLFLRVFDQRGSKTHKGFLSGITDSSMTLLVHQKSVVIPVKEIDRIRMRWAFGHSVLIGAVSVGVLGAIVGAASADPGDASFIVYDAGEGAVAGFLGGAAVGTLIGSIIAGTRNRPILVVQGNEANWKKVETALEGYIRK